MVCVRTTIYLDVEGAFAYYFQHICKRYLPPPPLILYHPLVVDYPQYSVVSPIRTVCFVPPAHTYSMKT